MYLILGAHQAGKDTTAEFLRDLFNLKYLGPTSKPLCRVVYEYFTGIEEIPDELSVETKLAKERFASTASELTLENVYEHRHKYSQYLYILGKYLRREKGELCLVEELLDLGTEIVVGLREKTEVRLAIQSGAFQRVIWVHRPNVYQEDGSFYDKTLEYGVDWVLRCLQGQKGINFSLITNDTESLPVFHVQLFTYFQKVVPNDAHE